MPEIALRRFQDSDAAMVYKTWLGVAWDNWCKQTEGCRACGRRYSYVGKNAFMDSMHARVTRLLGRSQCFAICPAPVAADSDYMIGFLVRAADLPVLHFVYVMKGGQSRASWRGLGVATQAMKQAFPRWPDEGIVYTQDSPAMRAIKDKWRATYNPFLVEG